MSSIDGALVVDKPAGPTSHDIVQVVRRALHTRAGHTGTLDPLATGVLVLLLGKATRLMPFFQGDEKVYWARIRLGKVTTTYDREGEVVGETEPPSVDEARAREILGQFLGPIQQLPPLFSAVRVGGERLYRAARRGEDRPRPPRTVEVFSIDLLELQLDFWTLRVHCSSGTYIRTLAHDLGHVLGCGAHLWELRREQSGVFDLTRAVDPQDRPEKLQRAILPLEELLPDLPRIDLPDNEARRVRHGNAVSLSWAPPKAPHYRLFHQQRLVALGRPRLSQIQPFLVLDPG